MLGSTVSTAGGLANGFINGDKWGCQCIQIYVTPSRTWRVGELSDATVAAFHAAWRGSAVEQVVAHVPYLVNLASADDELLEKSINRLRTEIDQAGRLGVPSLILHPGSHGQADRAEGIVRLAAALRSVVGCLRESGVAMLLETMAGQGGTLGSSFEEIADMMERIGEPELLGVCFDTAHVFQAGYDLRGRQGWHTVLNEFDRTVGLGRIKAIHLNDSQTTLGSHRDRHALPGQGQLGLDTMRAVLTDERFMEVPAVLEPPASEPDCQSSLALLRQLALAIEASG